MNSSLKRLGASTFYGWMYCGFDRESRVPHAGSETQGTQRIFARCGLALLLSTGNGHVAWAKSQEFPMQILISMKLDAF